MITDLGALKLLNKKAWEKKIRAAMKRAEGRIPDAAADLGVHVRTLYRYLDDSSLLDVPRVPNGARRKESAS